ncbi:hypothetical protein amb2186 [Paramagnetospirillum magneticum AMB-1]|uniref:Uncharacterized protein n=1 Tax=Paramagnetospirillum magneticum (strain ATCC 700264 / AMB-1) TaxID=342108 RepID=Q2W585_PARM1|nr:hypothetical protein amb2186 [Paramagnetospirillum magneticum AMB-1]
MKTISKKAGAGKESTRLEYFEDNQIPVFTDPLQGNQTI